MYSDRIKKIREALDLSVAKLSKKINIPVRTITSYELDGRTPSLDFLAQLCKELNISSEWFLFGKGEMFNAPQFEDVKGEILKEVEKMLKERGL